jgi:phosphatidylglycerol:prolipoprotein diacylglycerol transferase
LLTTPYFTLHTFGLLLAIAYLAALWWVVSSARREGLDPDRAMSLGLWSIVGAILGAKLLMIVRSLPDYVGDPASLLSLSTLESAGDFYGGFLGALVAASIFFARTPEMPVWQSCDLCGPAIALGQAIGRVGCFMAGDDYGSPTELPWAVTFTHPDAAQIGGAPLGVPLHPVQLYESLFCLALFFLLAWYAKRKRFQGEVILLYSLIYAVGRFFLELVRGDADRGFVLNGLLSTSQFIAVFVACAATVLLFARRRDREKFSAHSASPR